MNKMGFGFLRLPQTDDGAINGALLNQMVDAFLERGGVYFDTAYTYLNGQSETALREALVKRHPRERFQIADKLPSWMKYSLPTRRRRSSSSRSTIRIGTAPLSRVGNAMR
ncbi:aldo/keto reductase [Lachnospiraceae bacterium 45-P1]